MEDFSSYLRDHDMNDVVRDAESYARREPLVFLGAAFAAGFIAARFLKASSPNRGTSGRSNERTWANSNRSRYQSA